MKLLLPLKEKQQIIVIFREFSVVPPTFDSYRKYTLIFLFLQGMDMHFRMPGTQKNQTGCSIEETGYF